MKKTIKMTFCWKIKAWNKTDNPLICILRTQKRKINKTTRRSHVSVLVNASARSGREYSTVNMHIHDLLLFKSCKISVGFPHQVENRHVFKPHTYLHSTCIKILWISVNTIHFDSFRLQISRAEDYQFLSISRWSHVLFVNSYKNLTWD